MRRVLICFTVLATIFTFGTFVAQPERPVHHLLREGVTLSQFGRVLETISAERDADAVELVFIVREEMGYHVTEQEIKRYATGKEVPPEAFLVALWLSLGLTYAETIRLAAARQEDQCAPRWESSADSAVSSSYP